MKREVNIVLGFFILTCLSIFQLAAQQSNPVGVTLIVVNFDQAPDPAQVFIALAPLKYDKDFALSMEIDDGGLTIFEQGFPVFEGGVVNGTTYPGLTYSDGCDNLYHFKMSSVLFSFNGDGENGPDVHVDNAYEMVSWDQLNTLVQNNWGVINHGVNTNANTDPAFMDYSISRNQSYIRRQLYQSTPGGVITHLHVNPNGSEPWTTAASNLGYISTYNQNQPSPLGDHGGNVNNPATDWTQFQNIYRLDAGPTNMQQFVSGLADSSINGANYWGAVFTHSLLTQYPFNTFVSDFNFINNTYGSGGLDNILMTSDEEIRDYLLVRDAVTLNYIVNGSVAYITFTGDVPDNLKFYSMSINVSSNTNITDYTVYDTEDYTFNGIGTNQGLINVNWDGLVIPPPEQLADDYTNIAVNSELQRDAWIAMDYVTTLDEGQHKDSLRHVLCNLGLVYDEGFCSFLTVDLGPDTTICQGNCVPLSGPIDMAYYHWFVADIIYDTVQSILACPMDTTQFILIVEDNFGNVASDSIVISVRPSPIVNLGNNDTLCVGDNITLTGPAAPDGDIYHYQWSTDDTTQSITVPVIVDSLYFLDVTNVNLCTGSDTIAIYAVNLPVIDSISGDTTACFGIPITLEVFSSDTVYLWNTGETTKAITVTPDTVGDNIYWVEVSNDFGCQSADTLHLEVFPQVIVSFDQDSLLVCQGQDAVIWVNNPDTVSLSWTYNGDNYPPTGDSLVLPMPSDSGYVYVTGTDANNCSVLDSLYLKIGQLPDITTSPDTSICYGDSVTLSITGGVHYYWTTDGLNFTYDSTLIVSPIDTTVYYVGAAYADSICFRQDSITVNVRKLPTTKIDYAADTVCEGSLVTLYASGADTYRWKPSEITDDSLQLIINVPTKVWLEGTTVRCTVIDSVTIDTLLTPIVTLSGLFPIYCESDPFSILFGEPPGGDFSGHGVTNNLFYPHDAGPGSDTIVYKWAVNEAGCYGYDTAFISVYGGGQPIDLGTSDTTLRPADVLRLDAGAGFDSYFWSTGSTDSVIFVLGTDHTPGDYEYKVIALINGCTSSGSVNITFLKPDFIDFSQAGIINLYPNPNTGFFTIVMPYTSNPKTIKLFSMDGNLMFEQNNLFCQDDECRLEVLIPDLNTGIYILQLISGDHVYFKKVMIRK
jgi:hypothetical protein